MTIRALSPTDECASPAQRQKKEKCFDVSPGCGQTRAHDHDGLGGQLADAVLWRPVRRGAKVTWTLRDAEPDWFAAMLGPFVRWNRAGGEEHHGGVPEDTPPTTGTVTLIAAVHCRYAPRAAGPATLSRVPASLRRSSRRMGGSLIAARSDSWVTSCNSSSTAAMR